MQCVPSRIVVRREATFREGLRRLNQVALLHLVACRGAAARRASSHGASLRRLAVGRRCDFTALFAGCRSDHKRVTPPIAPRLLLLKLYATQPHRNTGRACVVDGDALFVEYRVETL
jgi:hypothetical protein